MGNFKKYNRMKKVILLTVLMLAAASMVADSSSQYKKIDLSKSRSGYHYKPLDLPIDSMKPGSRFTLSTNLLEWAIVAPNLGLEYDLKDPRLMSSPSIYFQFTFRPGQEDIFSMDKEYNSRNISFWRARFEYRWHFRFNERKEQRKGLAIPASWINEHWFTKSMERYVPDEDSIAAGNPDAVKLVKDRQTNIDRKIDSTMVSTIKKRTQMFPGRWYSGIFGEVFGYDINTNFDGIFFGKDLKDKSKIGNAVAAGLSAGYEFPGFNYNHKFFMQWSVGASIGGVFAFRNEVYGSNNIKDESLSGGKFIPMPITELRVALNFRNTTISQKYWQPDNSVYDKNIMQNRDDSIHMAELDSVLEANPVIIRVHSVNGFDSTYTEILDKNAIVRAFQQSTGLTYLLPQNFNMLSVTQQALDKKELSDNYFVEYTTINRLRNYEDSVYVNDRKNLKFGVEIEGRAEADSLLQSFKDSLTNYFQAHNNTRPIFYGEPATKDSLKSWISKDTIAAVFSRIWGHQLDTTMIRSLLANRTVMNDDGTTDTFLDSIIDETSINRRAQYAMFIQFHPQVTLSGEDFGVARFNVAMAGADAARDAYNSVVTYYNSLAKIGIPRIQRRYNGYDDTFEKAITKEEVLELFAKQGLEYVNPDMTEMSDSIFAFNNMGGKPDTITFHFGVTESDFKIPFIVEDSVGKAQAMELRTAVNRWYATSYWQYEPESDPEIPAYFDSINNEWNINKKTFIEILKKIEYLSDVTIEEYQLDSVLHHFGTSRTGAIARSKKGLRAYAQFRYHREVRNNRGEQITQRVPYQLIRVATMEEAGFVEEELDEFGNPIPKPEFIGPDFKTQELYDEMGKSYKVRVYEDSLGTKHHVLAKGNNFEKVNLDEFGDVAGTGELDPAVLEWITPKPFFRDSLDNLIPAVMNEEGKWVNPLSLNNGAPKKKVLKPEMIGPEFATEEMYDEMGKSYKVRIYEIAAAPAAADSTVATDSTGVADSLAVPAAPVAAAQKVRVLANADGTFSGVVLDEFGDFGGTEALSDEVLDFITPKPFFRDSLNNLIPALKDENGEWIDPFAQPEVQEAEEEVVAEPEPDLEAMTPKERKAYEKQKAAEAKAKAKAEAAAKKKAAAEAKAAAKKAAAEAKKKGKKTAEEVVETAAETISETTAEAADALNAQTASADSAFNNLADSISAIASQIPGVSTEVVTLPEAPLNAASAESGEANTGEAAVAEESPSSVSAPAPVLSAKEQKALEAKQKKEAAAAAKKAAAEAKAKAKAEAAAKKKAAAEAKAAAKKAAAEAKNKAEKKVEETVEKVEEAVEAAAETVAETATETVEQAVETAESAVSETTEQVQENSETSETPVP